VTYMFAGFPAARLADILVGVVPLMAGTVLCLLGKSFETLGVWVLGVSPLAQPLFAATGVLPVAGLPEPIARAVPQAFEFWMVVMVLASAWLAFDLRRRRKAMAAAALAPPRDGSGVG